MRDELSQDHLSRFHGSQFIDLYMFLLLHFVLCLLSLSEDWTDDFKLMTTCQNKKNPLVLALQCSSSPFGSGEGPGERSESRLHRHKNSSLGYFVLRQAVVLIFLHSNFSTLDCPFLLLYVQMFICCNESQKKKKSLTLHD